MEVEPELLPDSIAYFRIQRITRGTGARTIRYNIPEADLNVSASIGECFYVHMTFEVAKQRY